MSWQVILASTNKETLELNRAIIEKLSGTLTLYLSCDSIVSDDSQDSLNFLPELLHQITVSGLPPHSFELKMAVSLCYFEILILKKGYVMGPV
jgi:PIF1-like helicase